MLEALRGRFPNPPDAVAHPRDEDELEATLERMRGMLDPETIATVEANLTLIDQAIEEFERVRELGDADSPIVG